MMQFAITTGSCSFGLARKPKATFSRGPLLVRQIQQAVADYYNISLNDLLSQRRSRNITRPRQVAMYLAHHLTRKSYPHIGQLFDNRDHTTIIHGVRVIAERMQTDGELHDDVETLKNALSSPILWAMGG